jgi:hypothetical protein
LAAWCEVKIDNDDDNDNDNDDDNDNDNDDDERDKDRQNFGILLRFAQKLINKRQDSGDKQ